jgi:hypothetical protein
MPSTTAKPHSDIMSKNSESADAAKFSPPGGWPEEMFSKAADTSSDAPTATEVIARLRATKLKLCYEAHDKPAPHQEGTRIYKLPDRRDEKGPYMQFLIVDPLGKCQVVSRDALVHGMTNSAFDTFSAIHRLDIANHLYAMPRPEPEP